MPSLSGKGAKGSGPPGKTAQLFLGNLSALGKLPTRESEIVRQQPPGGPDILYLKRGRLPGKGERAPDLQLGGPSQD